MTTPRTNKERFTLSAYKGWLVHAEFAEELESENQELRELIAAWVSVESDKCRIDHLGVCYEHSHFDLPCPAARAREILGMNNDAQSPNKPMRRPPDVPGSGSNPHPCVRNMVG